MRPNAGLASLVATAIGIDLLASVIALVLFFAIGAPFGAINDWTIGLGGILGVILALTLPRPIGSTITNAAVALAVIGSALVVVGAALVITRTTGFLLAGLVESFGWALVGTWLVTINAADGIRRDGRLRRLGLAAGALMMVGLVVLPGIVSGVDDMNSAPGYVWLGFAGWLGIFFLFPLWGIWVGRSRSSP